MILRNGLTVFTIVFCFISQAQLVNIESLRMHTDSDRFVLENNLNFSYFNNNGSSIFSFGNSLGTQFKSKDLNKIYLILGNYRLIRAEGEDFQNNWFLHFRFNYKLEKLFNSKAFRIETFFQSQYNELLEVSSRNLIGAGLRFKIISNENEDHNAEIDHFQWKKLKATIRLYVGYAYMYEEEKSIAFDKRFYNHRNSSYLSFNFVSANGLVRIINTIYYQPLFSDFNDNRISEEFQVSYKISKSLSANSGFTYSLDSVTPQNNREYTSYLSFGFGINL
jgi:hypothetical protein